jgi:hypothetical protein
MMRKEWHKVPGLLAVEVSRTDGVWVNWDGKAVPACLGAAIEMNFPDADYENDMFEVVIGFESTGYYEPAQTCGPPDRWSPAEVSTERTLSYVRVNPPCANSVGNPTHNTGYDVARGVELPLDVAREVFSWLEEEVEDMDPGRESLEDS